MSWVGESDNKAYRAAAQQGMTLSLSVGQQWPKSSARWNGNSNGRNGTLGQGTGHLFTPNSSQISSSIEYQIAGASNLNIPHTTEGYRNHEAWKGGRLRQKQGTNEVNTTHLSLSPFYLVLSRWQSATVCAPIFKKTQKLQETPVFGTKQSFI